MVDICLQSAVFIMSGTSTQESAFISILFVGAVAIIHFKHDLIEHGVNLIHRARPDFL